ncbi:MAG: putative sulfate exporter family transporter [Phycisphaerales bacterium]
MAAASDTGGGPASAGAWRRGLGLWLILLVGLAVGIPWPLLWPGGARYQIEAALALGILLALAGLIHAGPIARRLSRLLIQACVVLLGLRMDLHEVWRAGIVGIAFAVATIAATFTLGWLLGRALRTDGKVTTLLSSGTAICGGSAIAAVSTVIGASAAQVGVATATVFTLNGVALFLFPWLGGLLGLSPEEFGAWAGVAIHDVSSVVGAAQSFDAAHPAGPSSPAVATDTATVVKLSRVIWIAPICIAAAWWAQKKGRRHEGTEARSDRTWRVPVPCFVLLFLLASAVRTAWPAPIQPADDGLRIAARCGMALALFLIGAGLSRRAIAEVGWRAMALGVALWVFIAAAALAAIRAGAA